MRLAVLPVLLLVLLLPCNKAHNWMIKPRPYQRLYTRPQGCSGLQCQTACQKKGFRPDQSRNNPTETYRRGETITVTYSRNNHRGGFVRLALVPVDKMFSQEWHKRMTLMHGCWEAGETRCSGRLCGTDKNRLMFKREVKIPDIFPDGDYVMGYVWYGGIDFSRSSGRFRDFFSCSHVRVRGGNPVSNGRYVPYWQPGRGEGVKDGKCQTSADAVGVCPNQACFKTRMFLSIPRDFKNGAKPKGMTTQDVQEGFGSRGNSNAPSGVTGKSFQGQSSGPKSKSRGICNGDVCCASSCGRCGGRNCDKLPGGWRCCRKAIRRTGRRCSKVGPPCKK